MTVCPTANQVALEVLKVFNSSVVDFGKNWTAVWEKQIGGSSFLGQDYLSVGWNVSVLLVVLILVILTLVVNWLGKQFLLRLRTALRETVYEVGSLARKVPV